MHPHVRCSNKQSVKQLTLSGPFLLIRSLFGFQDVVDHNVGVSGLFFGLSGDLIVKILIINQF